MGHQCGKDVKLFLKSALSGARTLQQQGVALPRHEKTYNYQNALLLPTSKAPAAFQLELPEKDKRNAYDAAFAIFRQLCQVLMLVLLTVVLSRIVLSLSSPSPTGCSFLPVAPPLLPPLLSSPGAFSLWSTFKILLSISFRKENQPAIRFFVLSFLTTSQRQRNSLILHSGTRGRVKSLSLFIGIKSDWQLVIAKHSRSRANTHLLQG